MTHNEWSTVPNHTANTVLVFQMLLLSPENTYSSSHCQNGYNSSWKNNIVQGRQQLNLNFMLAQDVLEKKQTLILDTYNYRFDFISNIRILSLQVYLLMVSDNKGS